MEASAVDADDYPSVGQQGVRLFEVFDVFISGDISFVWFPTGSLLFQDLLGVGHGWWFSASASQVEPYCSGGMKLCGSNRRETEGRFTTVER